MYLRLSMVSVADVRSATLLAEIEMSKKAVPVARIHCF